MQIMMTADNIIKKAHCLNAVVKDDNNTIISQKEWLPSRILAITLMWGEPGRCLKIFIFQLTVSNC